MTHLSRLNPLRRTALAIVAGGLLLFTSASPGLADDSTQTPPPFGFSSFAAEGRAQSPSASPPKGAALLASAPVVSRTINVGANVDVIGSYDVTQQATIGGTSVNTCNPGMQTAQNETTIAVNPAAAANLVGGTNDYRLYEPSENRYDGSGGFYQTTDGGVTWTAGFLPGLVRANAANPGPYESAGDPVVAAGPSGTFWYANLAFNRTDNANSVAVSRSTDSGASWTTSYVLQTSAAQGATLFNDKEWIGADPRNASVAYVTWTQFHSTTSGHTTRSNIVISKTTDGGASWSAPGNVSPYRYNQGSVVQVDANGVVRVVYEALAHGRDVIAYSVSSDGGKTFQTKILAVDNDILSPLPGASFRDNSFPAFAMNGSTLHIVWSNWNGSNADVVYLRSTDGGATWSAPATIAGGTGDQFFPWVAANAGKVYVSYFNRGGGGDSYTISVVASTTNGASWTPQVAVSSATSTVSDGNAFGFPNCAYSFIGDYSGVAVGGDGVAHPLWTDIRIGNDPSGPTGADQDPFTATISAS